MAYNFPAWMQKAPIAGQFPGAEMRWKAYNRFGGPTSVGSVYMFDMGMSQAETTNMNWQDAASCWRNIVAMATHKTGTGTATTPAFSSYVFCVATEAVADNAELEVLVMGAFDVLSVPSLATTFIPAWCSCIPVVTNDYVQVHPGTNGLTAAKQVGRTLVSIDQGSLTAARRSIYFNGFGMYS